MSDLVAICNEHGLYNRVHPEKVGAYEGEGWVRYVGEPPRAGGSPNLLDSTHTREGLRRSFAAVGKELAHLKEPESEKHEPKRPHAPPPVHPGPGHHAPPAEPVLPETDPPAPIDPDLEP